MGSFVFERSQSRVVERVCSPPHTVEYIARRGGFIFNLSDVPVERSLGHPWSQFGRRQ